MNNEVMDILRNEGYFSIAELSRKICDSTSYAGKSTESISSYLRLIFNGRTEPSKKIKRSLIGLIDEKKKLLRAIKKAREDNSEEALHRKLTNYYSNIENIFITRTTPEQLYILRRLSSLEKDISD